MEYNSHRYNTYSDTLKFREKMMHLTKSSTKPHVVFIPFPLQGHLTPMMKLAQLFHYNHFHVTFINTEFIHNRLSLIGGGKNLPDFEFVTLEVNGLPKEYQATLKDTGNIIYCTRNNFFTPLKRVVSEINRRHDTPAVTCVISDVLMSYTIKIAKEIGVPCMLFWTASAPSLMIYKSYFDLIEIGVVPVKDDDSNKIVDCIPGLENIRFKDLPFAEDIEKKEFPQRELEEAVEASGNTGIILNSLERLEGNILSAISNIFPQVYTVGPLDMLLNTTLDCDLKSIKSNLWEEQGECLEWLHSMETNSVIYISFGSLLDLPIEMITEFAQGILNTNFSFLWIMKSNPITDEILLTKLKNKGFITNWCPQEKVLNHPAIGGFITHGGWNSMLESICAGVPIICCPFFGDQRTNSRYCHTNWGIGLEMDRVFKKKIVEKLVKELMAGDQSKNMRENIVKLKKLAMEAVRNDGSSSLSLGKLLKDACNSSHKSIFMWEK